MATLINFEASILFILSFFPDRCSAFEKAEEELNLKVIVIRRNKGYFITALYSPVFYTIMSCDSGELVVSCIYWNWLNIYILCERFIR
jgi:hypothetical protein